MNASYNSLKKELNDALKTIERKENEIDDLRARIQNLEDERDQLLEEKKNEPRR